MTFAIASGFYDFDDLVRLATLSLASFFFYIFSKHLNVISWPVQDDPLPGSFFLPDATIIPARFAICQSVDHFATLQTRPPTSNQGKQMRSTASCKRTVHLVQLYHKFCLSFDNDKEQPEKTKIKSSSIDNLLQQGLCPVIEMTLRSLKTYFPVKLLLKEAVVTRIATISNHNKPLRLPLNILTILIVSHSPTWCYVTSLLIWG